MLLPTGKRCIREPGIDMINDKYPMGGANGVVNYGGAVR